MHAQVFKELFPDEVIEAQVYKGAPTSTEMFYEYIVDRWPCAKSKRL